MSEKGVSGQFCLPLLHLLHAVIANPSAENMITKLELFERKPEINFRRAIRNFFRKAKEGRLLERYMTRIFSKFLKGWRVTD